MPGNGRDSLTSDTEPAETLAPGSRLGKYEIRRLLGAGGMGAVYEAYHTEIGKRVAVKVLAPELAAAPGARARFLREAQLTSKINHPNIVDVNDMGNEDGRAFIVMEFLDGEDLSQRVDRTGPMAVEDLVDIMLPVCSAVAEAHRVGITHRDLKPQNIFLAAGPRGMEPKVLDFGISKGADTMAGALTGTGMIGTPFYFAPEQILDAGSAGPASDQYALGVILYECLTGRRPYEAESLFLVFQSIVDGNARPVGELRPDLPLALQQIVARAMHKGATARFASAAELGRALLPFASARQRSFWEHAFTGVRPAETQHMLTPAPNWVATPPGRLVPATTPMPRTPLPPAPGTPVPSGTMPLPSSGSHGRGARFSGANAALGPTDLDLRIRPRRWPILVVGGLLVAGAAAALLLGAGRRPAPATEAATATEVVPPPVAAPAPHAAVVPPPAPAAVPAPPPVAPPAPAPKVEAAHRRKPAGPAHHASPAPPRPQHEAKPPPSVLNPNAAPIID